MKLISYVLAIVLLSALMVPMSIGTYVAYSSTDDDDMTEMIAKIRNVIMLALKLDKVVRTIKLNKVIAV